MYHHSFDVGDLPTNILFQQLANLMRFFEINRADDDISLQKTKAPRIAPDKGLNFDHQGVFVQDGPYLIQSLKIKGCIKQDPHAL